MSMHSSIIGGSTAARLLKCPGSYQTSISLPQIESSNEYAEEGTFAHAVMERLMSERKDHLVFNARKEARDLIGEHIYDRVVTSEHIEELIAPALLSLEDLERAHGGDFRVIGVEQRVKFPGVIGAFGTVDLILASRHVVLHVDWKFGKGIPVEALDRNNNINPQLLYYVTACRATLKPDIYRWRDEYGTGFRKTMVAAIIQPRSEIMTSSVEIRQPDITAFRALVENAVDTALKPQPYREKGEHCRFAPCKLTCPLWTGPLLNLAGLSPIKPDSPAPKATAFGEYLAHVKQLVDQLEIFKKEIDDQMHAYLEAGGSIPGWRLKAKVKQRQWIAAEIVERTLHDLGFAPAEIWQRKLQTFAVADAAAKRRGVTIPDDLRVTPASNETTIATSDDPAPVVERSLAIEQFRHSLKALVGGGK